MCNRPGGRVGGKPIARNLVTCGDQEMHVFMVNLIEGRFIMSCLDLSGASRRAILPFLCDSACVCTGARSSPIGISCPAAITDKSGYDMINRSTHSEQRVEGGKEAMRSEPDLDLLVEQARTGDKEAPDALVRALQDRVYNLALRMLWNPSDAEDATQEILVKVITHLSQFRQESAFLTWVYQIATNHLLTTRRHRAESAPLTFAFIGDVLEASEGGSAHVHPLLESQEGVEQALLVKDLQIRCTLGMLLCLDREHRLAYTLSEVFQVTGRHAASILLFTNSPFPTRFSRPH